MKISSFIFIIAVSVIVTILQVSFLGNWPWLRLAIQLPLLIVLIVTVQSDWRMGLLLAVVVGLLYQLLSSLPPYVHLIALMVAAGSTWLVRRRFFTLRTGLSFLLSILIGTIIYDAVLAGMILTNRLFHSASLTPDWPTWVQAAAWQLGLNPFLAGLWWLTSDQRRAALRISSAAL